MRKYLEILKKCPLFLKIEEDDILRVLHCLDAKVDFFDKKYTVFAEGSPAKYIGVLLFGSAQTVRVDYYGNRSILSTIRPGNIFAEAFACSECESMPVSVIANEPSEILLLNCSHILQTCSNSCGFHQRLIFNLMKELADKNLYFHQKIDITSKRTTRDKLLTYLLSVAKQEKSHRFTIPFNRQELADYLEVDRSGLSVEIGNLRREGILESYKNEFELKRL